MAPVFCRNTTIYIILFHPRYPIISHSIQLYLHLWLLNTPFAGPANAFPKNIRMQKVPWIPYFPQRHPHTFHGQTEAVSFAAACVNFFKKALYSTFRCPGFKPSTTLGMALSTSYLAHKTSSLFTKSWRRWADVGWLEAQESPSETIGKCRFNEFNG